MREVWFVVGVTEAGRGGTVPTLSAYTRSEALGALVSLIAYTDLAC